jgi:hypothetical protein
MLDAIMLLPGLLVVPMVCQMLPRQRRRRNDSRPRVFSVAFSAGAVALGGACIINGIGAMGTVPSGGAILLLGGLLLAAGVPAVEWVESTEERRWP